MGSKKFRNAKKDDQPSEVKSHFARNRGLYILIVIGIIIIAVSHMTGW